MSRLLLDHDIDGDPGRRRRPAASRRAERASASSPPSSPRSPAADPSCRSSCRARCRRRSTPSATWPRGRARSCWRRGSDASGGDPPAAGGGQRRDDGGWRGQPDPLGELLLEWRCRVDDPRRAHRRRRPRPSPTSSTGGSRSIVLGHDAGVRAAAEPSPGAWRAPVTAGSPSCRRRPSPPTNPTTPSWTGSWWSTVPADRHRIRDRMRELRIAPWADAAGDGAALRMAAARAALVPPRRGDRAIRRRPAARPRRVAVAASGRPCRPRPSPSPTSTSSAGPAPASTRSTTPGCSGRSGRSPMPAERATVIADLVDDLLAPARQRRDARPACAPGESAGSVARARRGRGSASSTSCPAAWSSSTCRPARPPSPSSGSATASGSGARGRHFAVDVAGGLGGLLVDLRDVPLRLPDRADRRRDLLAAWQAALWQGSDT